MKKSKIVRPSKRLRKAVTVVLGLSVLGILYWALRDEKATVGPSAPEQPNTAKAGKHLPAGKRTPTVPPYYGTAEAARPFPSLLPAEYFRETPLVARAYRVASEIPEVLAQQPCYCYCDKYGHKSLLDCYTSDHAAG